MSPAQDLPAHPTIAIVGAGRAGSTLALAAVQAGYEVSAVYTRTPGRGQALAEQVGARLAPDVAALVGSAGLIFLAVPDDAIALVDAAGAGCWRAGMGVVHHSGLHGAALLSHAAAAGALTGTLHPLQAITDPVSALRLLPGTYFGVSGDPRLLPILQDFVQALGGRPLTIPDAAKPLYHAAAVFASNYIVTCFAQAVDLLVRLGIDPDDAAHALLPLTQGAVANLQSPGLPQALTGPISRGDAGTLTVHQEQLASYDAGLLPLYRLLGQATIPIAAAQGRLAPTALAALAAALSPSAVDPMTPPVTTAPLVSIEQRL